MNVNIFRLWIVRHCYKNDSCATKVVLQHALQLVASKLPAQVASCDKALSLMFQNYNEEKFFEAGALSL